MSMATQGHWSRNPHPPRLREPLNQRTQVPPPLQHRISPNQPRQAIFKRRLRPPRLRLPSKNPRSSAAAKPSALPSLSLRSRFFHRRKSQKDPRLPPPRLSLRRPRPFSRRLRPSRPRAFNPSTRSYPRLPVTFSGSSSLSSSPCVIRPLSRTRRGTVVFFDRASLNISADLA